VGFDPQGSCSLGWIQADLVPPRCFVTVAVKVAMMSPAERDCELITDLAAKSAVLREPQMMRVARLTPAD
jgi:hypothetical protein